MGWADVGANWVAGRLAFFLRHIHDSLQPHSRSEDPAPEAARKVLLRSALSAGGRHSGSRSSPGAQVWALMG